MYHCSSLQMISSSGSHVEHLYWHWNIQSYSHMFIIKRVLPLQVSLQTKIALPPADLYELLTRPDNSDVFRNIKVSQESWYWSHLKTSSQLSVSIYACCKQLLSCTHHLVDLSLSSAPSPQSWRVLKDKRSNYVQEIAKAMQTSRTSCPSCIHSMRRPLNRSMNCAYKVLTFTKLLVQWGLDN